MSVGGWLWPLLVEPRPVPLIDVIGWRSVVFLVVGAWVAWLVR